jgi:hypothetical protein
MVLCKGKFDLLPSISEVKDMESNVIWAVKASF